MTGVHERGGAVVTESTGDDPMVLRESEAILLGRC
jgi:hypothetical protein